MGAPALQRSLDALSDAERKDPDVAGNLYATLGNALRLCGPGRDAEAQEAFTRAIELDPERGEWWYDAGLLDKWRGRFDEGYAANEQARMRLGPERPVLWNLAICATALGKAEEAVEAWEEIGVPRARSCSRHAVRRQASTDAAARAVSNAAHRRDLTASRQDGGLRAGLGRAAQPVPRRRAVADVSRCADRLR